jgi:hypothetical protein
MKLSDLYKRSINRRIDPVATVSELDEGYVEKEIDEYFFTDTLFKHLHTLLKKIAEGMEGRTGVWINGYYGSGKSHFLKYIYYCLSDAYGEQALDHFEGSLSDYEGDPLDQPVTEGDARRVRSKLDKLTVDPLMFNIKTVADDEDDDVSVTRVFYNQLNEFRGYNKTNIQIARFEKLLDEQGQLEAFKEAFEERTGDAWDNKANDAVGMMLDDVVGAADEVADIDPESTRTFLQKEAQVSIEVFIDRLEAFLADKPDDYRLIYLVDEVSQFMEGRPNMLLDLQTIIEQVGDRLGDQVWVVCTAQQDLSRLVSDIKEKQQADYSYGKIMGRFETYLPLESQQADRITRKRVLAKKKSEGTVPLREYFRENETAIRNQFQRTESELYRGYQDEEEFVDHYPFVPYQFKLILEVIRAFERAEFFVQGISSTERSLIGNVHEVAKACKDEDVGYFAPFDMVYNAQISDYLTHRARSIINNALQLDRVRNEAFAQRVVKTLFLVSNLREDQSGNFPATAENIAFTLIDEVDPNWSELKRKTQDLLDYLVDENVVSESEGTYRFLQEEEIRVKREIDKTQITRHDRLETVAEDVIGPTSQWSNRFDLKGTKIRLRLKVDDYQDGSSGDAVVQFRLYHQEDPEEIAIRAAKHELVFCLNETFSDEQQKKLHEAVRIESYLQDHLDSATDQRREAMHHFQQESQRTLKELCRWFEKSLSSVSYVTGQQVRDASDHNGQSAQSLYESIVTEHLWRLYDKRDLATLYADKRSDLEEEAKQTQTQLDDRLTEAETEVHNQLTYRNHPTVADIVRHFSGAPFGWQDTEVIHILLRLEARNKWTFQYKSEDVDRLTFVKRAVKRQERDAITIHEMEDIDPALLHEAVTAMNQTIFNADEVEETTDPKRLEEEIRETLRAKRNEAEGDASDHHSRPFAQHFEALASDLKDVAQVRGARELFEEVVEQADELQSRVDRARELLNFWGRNDKKYKEMSDLVDRHRHQTHVLDSDTQSRLDKLTTFVESEDRPHQKFRSALDYFEAVQDAIDERVDELKAEVEGKYDRVFDELEARQEKLGVDDVVPDRQVKFDQLDQLDRTEDLGALDSERFRVEDYRARYLKELNEAAQEQNGTEEKRETEFFEMNEELSRHELETEEDVEAFVDDLKGKLLARVRDDKIVIIK